MRPRILVLLAASAAAISVLLQSNALQAKTIDGFGVWLMPLPTFDSLPYPDSETGNVQRFVGSKEGAFDPFFQIPGLQGVSPYLAIFPGGSATFTFTPRHFVRFHWGTPDFFNTISFYSGGKLVGTLLGADFQKAYGISESNRPFPIGYDDSIQIRSFVLFDTVVLSDSVACCFEFTNFRPY